jgi:hypothetical protein
VLTSFSYPLHCFFTELGYLHNKIGLDIRQVYQIAETVFELIPCITLETFMFGRNHTFQKMKFAHLFILNAVKLHNLLIVENKETTYDLPPVSVSKLPTNFVASASKVWREKMLLKDLSSKEFM